MSEEKKQSVACDLHNDIMNVIKKYNGIAHYTDVFGALVTATEYFKCAYRDTANANLRKEEVARIETDLDGSEKGE
jgi:hypothetical protein